MSVNAYVVSSVTAASRPRVQSTSYASPQKPESVAIKSAAFPAEPTASDLGSIRSRSGATVTKDRRSHASAIPPTPRSMNAARVLVPTTPSQKIKMQPVTRQPTTAPAVLDA